MATAIFDGPVLWGPLTRGAEGHREYWITHQVLATPTDGPKAVLDTAGLPSVGAAWNFDSDLDVWAFCHPNATVSPHPNYKRGDKTRIWDVRQKFSTKPLTRCQDETIGDPLLEPQKVSGSFVKYTEEITKDRNGRIMKSSSLELFRGPQVEFDHNRPTVRIEQNVLNLELATFSEMVDRVNDAELWGLEARKIKLSNVSWERKLYGVCNYYYTRIFEFDIDFNTFDRTIYDHGTKVLHGDWDRDENSATVGKWVVSTEVVKDSGVAPDADNPQHFVRYKDWFGENTRALLDGNGLPLAMSTGTGDTQGVEIDIEYYEEANFLLLNIPTTF